MSAQIVKTPAEVAALPDGTVIVSADNCAWPYRYAGRRWRKDGCSLVPLDADPFTGRTYSAYVVFFKDPLPAEVAA